MSHSPPWHNRSGKSASLSFPLPLLLSDCFASHHGTFDVSESVKCDVTQWLEHMSLWGWGRLGGGLGSETTARGCVNGKRRLSSESAASYYDAKSLKCASRQLLLKGKDKGRRSGCNNNKKPNKQKRTVLKCLFVLIKWSSLGQWSQLISTWKNVTYDRGPQTQ